MLAWGPYSLIVNAYEVDDNWLSTKTYFWDNEDDLWNNTDSVENTYDSENNRLQQISIVWDAATESMVNSFRVSYGYDSDNNLTTILLQNWDTTSDDWTNIEKISLSYIGASPSGMISELWEDGIWKPEFKNEYDYIGDKVSAIIYHLWNGTTADFVKASRADFTYNSYDQVTEISQQNWNDIGVWEPAFQKDFFVYELFEDPSSLENQMVKKQFNLYPNPADNILYISMQEMWAGKLSISDISGKIVYSVDGLTSGKTSIPLINLSAGTYFLLIEGDKGCSSQIFIKR